MRNKDKEQVKQYHRKWHSENPEKSKLYRERHNKKYPWQHSYSAAKRRCEDKCNKNYGERGIKFELTREDCAFMWARDKAHNLKKHSIDRIDNDGNYTVQNCRFIEFSENSARQKRYNFKVGTEDAINIYNEYLVGDTSHRKLAKKYNVSHSTISYIVKQIQKKRLDVQCEGGR